MSSRNKAVKPTNSKKTPSSASSRKKSTKSTPSSRGAGEAAGSSSTMANDITGVVLAVLSIALFLSVITNTDGFLAAGASSLLLHLFGLGAYILPVAMFVWAATFFVRTRNDTIWRVGLGLGLILLAVLAMLSMSIDGAQGNTDLLFIDHNLISTGGYVGGGIAWVLLVLVGKIIGMVILVGLAIVGCVVIGFSISGLVQRSQERIDTARKHHQTVADDRTSVRSRRGQANTAVQDDGEDPTELLPMDDENIDEGATRVINRDKPTQRKCAKESKAENTGDSNKTILIDHAKKTPAKKQAIPAPTATEGFSLPPLNLLKETPANVARQQARTATADLKEVASHLQETLESFNLYATVVGWVSGPTFTMFKVEMPTGVKLNKITGLQDDIALALAAESVRIFAPIPGTSLVGIEVPNRKRANVLLGDVLKSTEGGPLMLAIGKDVEGDMISADLSKMPHLLIGGTTGSGKSVAINSMLMSILMRATPDEVRMILIDPKRVELSLYNGIPHLYVPVVTDPKQAASTLAWATIEMDRRLKVFEKAGTRNIGLYNSMVQDGRLGDDAEELPYIVVVIDELSDLMMVAGKEVEGSIVRISQLARAAGIHLIVATQRPSSNVVTGMIKANIVNRISFKVATSVDSRVILDQSGAEKLVGLGDLLFLRGDAGEPKRIQGCYVSEAETLAVVEHLKEQGEPDYHEEILNTNVVTTGGVMDANGDDDGDEDPLLWDAAEIVVSTQMGSTSNIQRRLRVGYSRAGRIMDQLEAKGIVGPPDGSRPREVMLETAADLEAYKALDNYENSEDDRQ